MIASLGANVRLPYPHTGQQIVRKQARRFNWLSAGRRWRKTTLAMTICVENALLGKTILWGAPTYNQVRVGMDEAKRALYGHAQFNLSRMEVTLPGGGRVMFRSLDDPDNARGFTADGIVIDESADVKPQAWYEVLRPMLIDTDGWLWAIGTPKGRNWFWVEHMAARDRADSMAWQVPTLGVTIVNHHLERKPHPLENPEIPFDEIDRLYQTMPERVFLQEILAEFVESQNSVFRNLTANMTAPVDPQPADHAEHTIVMGCDWAKAEDYSAFSVGCVTCGVELECDRFNQIDYHFQVQRLRALAEKWGAKSILTELNSIGEVIFEALQRMGLPVVGFQTTAQTKPPLIENLALAFERQEWGWQPDPIWKAELEAYDRNVSPVTGRASYSAPPGQHDDTVIARALMLWQAQHHMTALVDFA